MSSFLSQIGVGTVAGNSSPTTGRLSAPTVVLIRHGETALGRRHIIERVDTPLDDRGRQTVATTAGRIQLPVRRIYSGTPARSLESGQIVSHVMRAQQVPIDGLRAWDTGMYDGVKESEANPILAEYKKHPQATVPDGESYANHLTRAITAAHALFGEARLFPEHATVVVTHSSVISPWSAWLKAGHQGYHVDWPTIHAQHGNPPMQPGEARAFQFGSKGWQERPL